MNRFSILLFAVFMFSFPGQGQAADPETQHYTNAFDLYTAFEVVWVREQAKVARWLSAMGGLDGVFQHEYSN